MDYRIRQKLETYVFNANQYAQEYRHLPPKIRKHREKKLVMDLHDAINEMILDLFKESPESRDDTSEK